MRITPSILNADLADIANEVARVPSSDMIHFDVMDNHFVPNLTLGLPVVESLKKHTATPIDVHLMIEDADTWAPQYAELGCESVTFHAEAAKAPIRLARELRRLGSRAAMALNPTTPIEPYADIITEFLEGLLGADLVGFQVSTAAANFRRLVRARTKRKVERDRVTVDALGNLQIEVETKS